VWALFAMMSGCITFQEQWWTLALIVIIIRALALSMGAVLWWRHVREITLGRLDYISIILAWLVLILSRFLPTSIVIFFLILIDFLILTPSLKKIWMYPETEDTLAWLMAGCSGLFMVITLPDFSFSTAGYFIYWVTVNLVVAVLIYRRQLYLKNIFHAFRNYFSNLALKKKL
jgi:hypothetical protein